MNLGESKGEQNLKELRYQHIARRSKRLRMLAGVLTPEAFAKRKHYMVAPVRPGRHPFGARVPRTRAYPLTAHPRRDRARLAGSTVV